MDVVDFGVVVDVVVVAFVLELFIGMKVVVVVAMVVVVLVIEEAEI